MKKITTVVLIIISCLVSVSASSDTSGNYSAKDLIKQNLSWQGRDRTYWLHLPPKAKLEGPLAVLFFLHGGGGTAKGTSRVTYNRFNYIADREGFIVVYPEAIAKNWNDGRKEHLKPENKDVDDVGFIAAIIDQLKSQYNIHTNRIFTTGMSNGGFMSTRLLCERSDLFRGGAILTASVSQGYFPECNPAQAVAVLVMNGTADPIVPYEGGEIRLFGKGYGHIVSHHEFVDFWKVKNGCDQELKPEYLPNRHRWDGTTVHIRRFGNCNPGGALKVYEIQGGGHTWPGGKQYLGKRIIGNTSREINACDEIWSFFSSLE